MMGTAQSARDWSARVRPSHGSLAPLFDALAVAVDAGDTRDATHAGLAMGRVLAQEGAEPGAVSILAREFSAMGLGGTLLEACSAAAFEGYVRGRLLRVEQAHARALTEAHTMVCLDAVTAAIVLPASPVDPAAWVDGAVGRLSRAGIRTVYANVPARVLSLLMATGELVGVTVLDASSGVAARLGVAPRSDPKEG